MRNTGRVTAISLLLLLAGCVRSLQPLYTEQDLIFEKNLIGCWSEEGSIETWCFSKQGEKAYQLVYTQDRRSGVFDVHLFRLEEQLFMDLLPRQQELKENDLYKFHLVPVHTFAHVKQIGPTLQMRFPDPEWFRKFVERNPETLRHEKVEREIIVTATTKEMQTFWLKHVDTEGAFKDFSNMERKVDVAPNVQSPKEETEDGK